MNLRIRLILFAVVVALFARTGQAGILTPGPVTNSSGQLVASPDWSLSYNSGTLGANVNPNVGTSAQNGTYPEQTLLSGWGNGSTGGSLELLTTLFPDGNQDLGSGVGAVIRATFEGTGNMTVFARDPWDSTSNGFGGLGFMVDSGSVTRLQIEILFDIALSPRPGVPGNTLSGAPTYGPYASAVGYKKIAGGTQSEFGLLYELLDADLNSLNAALNNPTFIDNRNGFPFPTLSPADSLLKWNDMQANGDTNMAYGSSFGIHDFNDGTTADDYVGGIRMEFTPLGGGSFEANAQFNYSVDGSSPQGNPPVVPEPGSAALLLLAAGAVGLRRRRQS